MRRRKCHSSISLRKFLLILNAVLFVSNMYSQVNWTGVISTTSSDQKYKHNINGNSALVESLLSFRQQRQKEVYVNTTGGVKDAQVKVSSKIHQQHVGHRRPSRTLMGIFSKDDGVTMRNQHRKLIALWNDTRLCSWKQITPDCQLIYAFVIGAGDPKTAPTQLVNETGPFQVKWPLLVEKPIATEYPDLNEDDIVLLNIRENMNEGKSESFFYFASTLMKQYGDIDYAMKFDSDASLLFHRFVKFAQKELPPAPYYPRIYAGILRDKHRWNQTQSDPTVMRKEGYWRQEYERVHVYLAGQCYLMSRDLVEWVVEEAPRSSAYLEGEEDHDLSAMVFHSPKPLTVIIIPKKRLFWEHPVKGRPRWQGILKRETARMKGEIYKGKKLGVA